MIEPISEENLLELEHRDSPVPLDAVIATAELNRRPSRAPNYEIESRAFAALMDVMANASGRSGADHVLQRLVETALDICRAHSAGVSILENEDGLELFRWRAVAGAWSKFLGGCMPRERSPCGTVLERNMPILMSHPERHYCYSSDVPPIFEVLLIPFHCEGKPVGTVWIVAHDDTRQFDNEDHRLMTGLSRFAATAYQLLVAHELKSKLATQRVREEQLTLDLDQRKQMEATLREIKARLEAELADSKLLQAVSAELINQDDVTALYEKIMDTMIAIMRSDFASMQILCSERGTSGKLRLLTFRGFSAAAAKLWGWISPESSGTTCSTGLRTGQRIIVTDIENCHEGVGNSEDMAMFQALGIRAIQSTPLFTRNGKLVGMISTHWHRPHQPSERDLRLLDILARQTADLIEQRQAEEALRHHKEHLELAQQAGHIGSFEWNIQSGAVTWSATKEELYGLPPGGFSGKYEDWLAAVHPEDREQAEAHVLRAVHDKTELRTRFRIIRTDGVIRWIAARGRVFYDAQGTPLRMIGINMDVTEAKHAEQALRDSEERLRLAAQTARFGVHDYDPIADRALWTEELYAISGIAVGTEVYMNTVVSLLHPDDRERIASAMQAALDPSGTGEFDEEFRIIRRDTGEVRWIYNRSKTFFADVPGHGCTAIRNTGIVIDITERKHAEETLRDADRRKDEFLAMLAHELRNPLAPVRNAVQILRLKGGQAPEVQWVTDVIDRQMQQMTRIIDDLLDLSRITRGKLELRKERVELEKIIDGALEISQPLIKACGHLLTVSLPPQPVYLEADLTRLSQVFSNLLNNAAKYSQQGGQIWLTAEQQEHTVVVKVKDTGRGIPPEMLPKVFEMFTQVDRSLERSQGGLGVGLTLAKSLVEMHGGTIAVHCDGIGKGCEFSVCLTLSIEPAGESYRLIDATAETVPISPLRILVVDDNRDAADSLGMMLRALGNEIHTAYDGLEAVYMAEQFCPDVVLLDIGLPKMNGYDVARKIREQPSDKSTILIAVTGWGQEHDRLRSKAAGFDQHLVKPVNPAEIMHLLASMPRAKTND